MLYSRAGQGRAGQGRAGQTWRLTEGRGGGEEEVKREMK